MAQAEGDQESQDRLRDLQTVIKEVFLPTLDVKSEIKHNIMKFNSQISNALTQAYGNVTIFVPPITASDEEIQRNPKMLQSFQAAVEDWTKKISETIEKEDKKKKDRQFITASGETEFWSNRSATFNTLFQQLQMPAVKKILNLLNNKDNTYSHVIELYQTEYKKFMKEQAQAKDFVKFLQTLDRQFKVISNGKLKAITETMKSLLDGLKLIWTISRHINHNIEQFEHILEAISNEICQKVREKIDIKTIFKKNVDPTQAIADIASGIEVLEKWQHEFNRTRQEIENELTIVRWDFTDANKLFDKPRHMVYVLKDLQKTCKISQEFYAILSDELAAVTGSRTNIDQVREKVSEHVNKLADFKSDIFMPENLEDWKTSFTNFNTGVDTSEEETINLINTTFDDNLNSAAGAFDLLDNFNDVDTRPNIRKQFDSKYSSVLEQYKTELGQMDALFEENKDNPPIPKNMPPNSGAIVWARSIITRVKQPIDKFKTKPEILTHHDTGRQVAKTYVDLAKKLTEDYEGKSFVRWKEKQNELAILYLKQPILCNAGSNKECQYKVNFNPNLRVIIREAKFLDRIGQDIPHTIVNIALQEKEYMMHIDGLNKLLREYNKALGDLRAVEKKLLFKDITKLNVKMNKGLENHNWFSLSISEYIEECTQEIERFKDTKSRVLQQASNIEKQVQTIENACIIRPIDFADREIMDITQFSDYFESYRLKEINTLVKDYQNIGDNYLKTIETQTFKSMTQGHEEMKIYYYYWERKIFNAINKMVIRALATNKALLQKTGKPLIRMEATFNNTEMNYYPSVHDLRTALDRFSRNIIESTKRFARWWDGFCKVFEESVDRDTSEKTIRYTFFDDVNINPVVSQLSLELVGLTDQIQQKFQMYGDRFHDKKFKYIYDRQQLTKMARTYEKQGNVKDIEKQIMTFKLFKKLNIKTKQVQIQNFLVLVDYSAVVDQAYKQVQQWLDALGKVLSDIAIRDLQSVISETKEYEKKLESDVQTIDTIKNLLNVINDIRKNSMDMELKISEVVEQFRVLKMYKYPIEKEHQDEVDMISENWASLVEFAEKQDFKVNELKESFAEVTTRNVLQFKEELKKEYERYLANGPGSADISLDEGVILLAESIMTIEAENIKKDEHVLSEQLFNLPISKFDELIKMETQNQIYSTIYKIYETFREQRQELANLPWNKLEPAILEEVAMKFQKEVKNLGTKKLTNPDQIQPFVKLQKTVHGFYLSIPQITELNHPAVKERHWKRIMEETGKDFGDGEFNLKFITLAKVFELELDQHAEKVTEICKEAKEEERNEKTMQKIENDWKQTNFTVSKYLDKGFAIGSPDAIRDQLEDHIMVLGGVAASKYARSVKKKVAQWEHDLNLVFDVIDLWMTVQRRWMYLEAIFRSDDIKSQLPEEAKKFGKTDANYCKIMESVSKNPNVLSCCVRGEASNRIEELRILQAELDKCEKSLIQYLEGKRMALPRFYFIPNEDLLEILGTSDAQAIQPHLQKLYDNCESLTFAQGGKIISHMVSEEDEKYEFETPIKPENQIEEWMLRVEEEMKRTLQIHAKKGVFYYAKSDRIEWISAQLGMIALVGSQIWWTFAIEDVFKRINEHNEPKAMKQELAKENQDLNDLIALVRTDISKNLRLAVNVMIILDVHARDIVERFVRDSVLNSKEFAWESQLRFYWDLEKDDIEIRQCTGRFDFCYEYQGLGGRLVITPLTDRCVMTLTTALTFYLGGAPAGPAGTGKTETVKDLAKGLAIRCVVTNCGETMDFNFMGEIFSGLIQTGFWGCFDEFNRINVEVLSVVSAQIKLIQNGLVEQKTKILFNEQDMRLIHTVGIYITMNPGYAGRSELPDNLKALFRPVVMVVPELLMICENILMSQGFESAKVLAKKMTVLYKLASEQLSRQAHYDFGLRALKSVLVMAGQLKRTYSDTPEDVVLMRALRDMNMPKFVFDDVPLFYGLITDLFPGLKAERVGYEDLKERIIEELDRKKMKHNDEAVFDDQVNKIMQLFETIGTRHTTMVVGPTGAGKSVIINTLAQALKEDTDIPTEIAVINPKAITLSELYGILDPDTRDWTDGLLSKTFKTMNKPMTPDMKMTRNWIIYDGDVDAIWVENMNSVMDDNRILTLTNGDRITLQKRTIMLFEVFDLQYASPATISRCGMVYVDPKNLGYTPYYEKWLCDKFIKYNETMRDSLKELFQKYVPPCMDRIYEGLSGEELVEPLRFITPRTNLNLVDQLCRLFDCVLLEPDDNPPMDTSELERPYLFCLTWSLGACLVAEDREKFNVFVGGLASISVQNLYDVQFDMKANTLSDWERNMAQFQVPEDGRLNSVIVPTVDTTRYSWLLNALVSRQNPVMFCGDSGSAKTVTVQSAFKQFDSEKYSFLNINFSSQTSSLDFQNIIEENIEKKTIKNYGPKTVGKKMIVFIDDLNMPTIDRYGTQPPIALLKFLVERNQLYQRNGELDLRDIIDTMYVGCVSPPGGSNNRVDPRTMSLYSCFNITFPSKESIQKIYSTLLQTHLRDFADDIQGTVEGITQATLQLYYSCLEKLPRTPLKFHYIFNLRDLSRVYEGLYLSTVDKFKTKASFIRLWRNECHRVFGDRLINSTDVGLVQEELIPGLIRQHFKDTEDEVLANPLFFADFALSEPGEESEDPRLYENMAGEKVKEKLDFFLSEYNDENQTMDLVLFTDALEHLTRIHRVIRFPKGSALLVGYGGSGKQSLTKLATYVAQMHIYRLNLTRTYGTEDLKEDLRNLYKVVVKQPKVFMFTDADVADEGFLELINNILTIGMVPSLFPEEEKDGLCSPLDAEMRRKKLPETKDFRWGYFVNRARENIHVCLCMSPAGDSLRIRCRSFPGLVSNTSIDWFFPWPEDALSAVAKHFLENVALEAEHVPKVIDHIVMIHLSVQKYSVDFEQVYKRKNFSTPKNYLDFIKNYMEFLSSKRKAIDSGVTRLEGGLATLVKAADDTAVLQEELAVQDADIAEKKAVVEEMIKNIQEKSAIAGKQEAECVEKKAFLEVQNKEIAEKKAEADEQLAEAEPIIQKAQEALNEIKQADLTELKGFNQVVPAVLKVVQITFYFYVDARQDDSWANVKKELLGDMGLLNGLKTFDISKVNHEKAKKAKKALDDLKKKELKTEDPNEVYAAIKNKSQAAAGLYRWAASTDQYYDIFRMVEPKKKECARLQELSDKASAELATTLASLEEVTEQLKQLNAAQKVKQDELDILLKRQAEMARKLNAASKLITGLGAEQKRWTQQNEDNKVDKIKLVGDCLTASAFLSYSGPFNFVLRKKMIFDHWKKDLIEKELPNKDNFSLQTFLSNDVEVARWASEGLPSDELSIQNGILTNFASRYPLCIDPQMQAVTWIKAKEAKNQFKLLTFNMSDYMKQLELCLRFGYPVLFENISTEIDPLLDPVLEKNIVSKAGVEYIQLGDQEVEFHSDFKLFMTTKAQNPSYSPEIFGKTMIINFNVTLLGLRDQLLNDVVGYEKPELEKTRKDLIQQTSANKAEQRELEDTLLSELSNSSADVPLVDNEPLIAVLEHAKTKSDAINEALIVAAATNEDIESNRDHYKTVAKRGAILFFALTGLSAISEMYEYSLDAYKTVFLNALETSKKDNVLTARLRFIIEKLTQLVYEFTCMGIFEVHKLMFSFQMTTMIMDGEEQLNRDELDFFLKGNTSLDAVENKPFKWLNTNGWKDAVRLQDMGGCWASLLEDIRENEKQWKTWYDLEAPEDEELPCGYTEKTGNDKFKQLLICRIFRPDRVVNGIKRFIIEKMKNDFYVKSPPIVYKKVLQQSTERTPIVFILSPGADPQAEVQRLIEEQGIGMSKFYFLALGQGMEENAKLLIERGAIRGHWVMLQNCHLLTSWLKVLEGIIETVKPDKAFRLWLTTMPTDKFPLGILQKSLKVVTEPPDGLGANVRQNFSKMSDEIFESCPKEEFKQLVYVLSFFHATIQERKKYGKIGWNVPYDFNDGDFRISWRLIQLYLNKAIETNSDVLPWETLRYLIGESMYGGRVTDDWDRRVLNTYLEEFLGEFIFDQNQKFYFSRADCDYTIPDAYNMETYMLAIDEIPLFTSPGVFGLHSNAEISYFSNSAKMLWFNTLKMQTSDGGSSGAVNKEEYVERVAQEIYDKLPEIFDIYNIKKTIDTPSPTQIVLLQELERFNSLLQVMQQSLLDLQRALVGEIGMSAALEELSNCIFNGFVSPGWLLKAPASLKNLVNWIEHFERRYNQYRDWIEIEEPKVIWLSGLHIPESYLTALLQTTCRARSWPLDKSLLYTEVSKERNPAKITKRLDSGTYIQGMFLEGAKWSIEKDCLDYQNPKELVVEMPLVRVIPVEANKLKLRGTIKTPVYVTQDRKNAMGKGQVFVADIKTNLHISHWILQGVALVLNTD